MKFNIRFKLILGFALLLVLSSIVQGISFVITREYVSKQISDFQEIQARKGASEIQSFFLTLNKDSLGIGQYYLKNRAELPSIANYTVRNSSYIKKIAILSSTGQELEKFDLTGQIPQQELTYEVKSDPFNSSVKGNTAISKVYYIDEGLGPHLDMFTPIFNDNHSIEGIVKMQINLNQLGEMLADIKLGQSGFIYVVDKDGRLISHPSEDFILQRPDLSSRNILDGEFSNKTSFAKNLEYINEKKLPAVAKAVTIPGYDWISVFEQQESEVFGFLDFIRTTFIITLVGSTFFLLLVALLLSENLTRPIRKLQFYMHQIEKGQAKKPLVIRSGDEIESLSLAFSSLIDQLLQRGQSLEEAKHKLENANNRLKELDRLKDDFVSVASHELRTPMTAIKSYLWMALAGQGGMLNDKQHYYIQRSYNSVDRLIKLVNDMLNISRIESGRLTVRMNRVKLLELTREVVDEVMPRANELGLEIAIEKYDDLPEVLADADKIKEVYYNLIGNSMKFTPKGGKITVAFVKTDGMVEIEVKDSGAGIAKEDLAKLFQKFGILPGSYITNQKVMGTGLGLYICRSLINLHGGKIWAASEGLGKGASMIFTLKKFSVEDMDKFNKTHQTHEGDIGLIHKQLE